MITVRRSFDLSFLCPCVESNHDHELRKLAFYPLNYRDIVISSNN